MSEWVCFCFHHTAADIEADVAANQGKSLILERIVAAKRAGECRCADIHPEAR